MRGATSPCPGVVVLELAHGCLATEVGRMACGGRRNGVGSFGVEGWEARARGRVGPEGPSGVRTTQRGFGILAASRGGLSLGRGHRATPRNLIGESQIRFMR